MRFFWIIVLFTLGVYDGTAQSKTIQSFIDEDRTGHRFYFYPSTLRMLNLQDDPEYYDMVKRVKKLVFFPFKADRFDDADFRMAVRNLAQEDFAEYISVEGTEGEKLYISGKTDPYETVALARFDGQYYAADLQGSIDVLQLSKLYQKIAERDTSFSQGFFNIFQMMDNNGRRHRHQNNDESATEKKDSTKKDRT